jgi:hypothetical protein
MILLEIPLSCPVNLDISPALDIQTLGMNYDKEVDTYLWMK